MEEINLGILDTNFNLVGVIDTIISFQTTTNLNTCSTFCLNVVLTEEMCKLLAVDNYLIINNKEQITEAYIIEYKKIILANNGQLGLQVQGRNLLSLLDRRVVTKLWTLQEDISQIAESVITNEIINASDPNRNIENLIYPVVNLNVNSSYANTQLYSNLLTEITSFLQAYDLGITIKLDLINKTFIISLIQGTNRSLEQETNQPVIFSNSLNNIMSESFLHTTKDYVNVAYVYAQIGTDNTTELEVVGQASGINRYECGTDCNQTGLTTTNYVQAFQNYGEIWVHNRNLKKCFSGTFNINNKIKYNVDFRIGDLITCVSSEWNINETLQITQITEKWSNAGYSLQFQLGQNLPSISAQLDNIKKGGR